MFPSFLAIFLKHSEGWLLCKDFARLMNEGCFPEVRYSIFFCFPTLYLYLRGTALYLVIQKAKLLNMNS